MLNSLFKSALFTWWNGPTFGTWLFTKRRGIEVGRDDQGNVYYTDKDKTKRWVVYSEGPVEASRVPPEWHLWLHKTVDVPPSEQPLVTQKWEKPHEPNLTGTDAAYMPGGSLSNPGTRQKTAADYEAWSPEG